MVDDRGEVLTVRVKHRDEVLTVTVTIETKYSPRRSRQRAARGGDGRGKRAQRDDATALLDVQVVRRRFLHFVRVSPIISLLCCTPPDSVRTTRETAA
jgi:hypothetical protein